MKLAPYFLVQPDFLRAIKGWLEPGGSLTTEKAGSVEPTKGQGSRRQFLNCLRLFLSGPLPEVSGAAGSLI